MKNNLLVILLVTLTLITNAQTPQCIPYQAVVRNTDGSVMNNTMLTMTFKIHDVLATGTVVYEETHSTTSNPQGLVSLNIGAGAPNIGSFATIGWGTGAKFLQVSINAGNGNIDLGTQQMMSVPYALYAEDVIVRVSATGDTLFIGNNYSIVPGVSAANPISISNYGSVLLPGNTTCQSEFISVTGCGGQDSLLYYDRYYNLVEIGGQCWFAENLATDKYSNGDVIPTGLNSTEWSSTTSGAYAVYANNPANDIIYGKLYNWYSTIDSRSVCPTGWHVPSTCEWMYLEGILGISVQDQQSLGNWKGSTQGGDLKSINGWTDPNIGATNSTGFSAIPGGRRSSGNFYALIGAQGNWWSSTQNDNQGAIVITLTNLESQVLDGSDLKYYGYSIRCIKD
jgi:uncharacterized protein (TIGR02145 family)